MRLRQHRRTRYGQWSPSATFSLRHGRITTSAIEASMLQAPACGTVYRRSCDETWTLRVSSVNWKRFYSAHCDCLLNFAPQKYCYLLTYLSEFEQMGFQLASMRMLSHSWMSAGREFQVDGAATTIQTRSQIYVQTFLPRDDMQARP